jgi:leucyl aminopeptidase (aminopeptidase T)
MAAAAVSLLKASERVINDCLGVQKGEEVLIIVDARSKMIGESLFRVCCGVKAEGVLVEIVERQLNGEEPPQAVAAAMRSSHVVIAPTTKSLSHTTARREASKAGVRIATMPGVTLEIMQRTMSSDYGRIAYLSRRLAEALSKGSVARVVSPGGTDITMSIEGRAGLADTGILRTAGSFGNLPAGEAYLAPVEGSAEGTVVIDGAMAGIRALDGPITAVIHNGVLQEIQGGQAARQLRDMLEKAQDKNAWSLAELGIGTNENAGLSGSLVEVEKVLGTVHLAFGDNVSMGGQVRAPIHVDGVVLRPTLTIDGTVVIRDGQVLTA